MSYDIEAPFFVIATQNPVETAGTFPLPEAQLDRFMMKLSMGALAREEELAVLERYMESDPLDTLEGVVTKKELEEAKLASSRVFVHKCIQEYIVDLVAKTREGDAVILGVSPRGSLALLKCAKAYAYLSGRDYCVPDDVKAVAVPVLAHRMILGYGVSGTEEMVKRIISNTKTPTEDFEA